MPECILKSGSAIKVGRIFILRYDSSHIRFNARENPPESFSDVLRQCRESIDINAQRILRRYMLAKHEPLEPASYDHHPMIVPKRRQRDFSECFLKRRSITTDSYPSRKPHGFPAQSTGGSAPTSCGIGRVGFSIRPIVARESSGERWSVPNRMPIPLLPKRKFRNPEDQRRNCRMNRDRQPDRQPDPKETLPAGNQPTGSLES